MCRKLLGVTVVIIDVQGREVLRQSRSFPPSRLTRSLAAKQVIDTVEAFRDGDTITIEFFDDTEGSS
jgi:hypothetical protein